MDEIILCAANYYNDNQIYVHCPKNVEIGFIICGHRHHNCIGTFSQMFGFPYDENANKLRTTEIQGFLTNHNRFVDRKEALEIAINAEQVLRIDVINPNIGLFSEDLY